VAACRAHPPTSDIDYGFAEAKIHLRTDRRLKVWISNKGRGEIILKGRAGCRGQPAGLTGGVDYHAAGAEGTAPGRFDWPRSSEPLRERLQRPQGGGR